MTANTPTTPPSPQEQILAGWQSDQGIQVSVCMLTYNHSPYLRDALNSVLNQKTTFGFEILVHDDASTDDTQAIIREYEQRYPQIVKPIYQTVNQYTQDINPSVRYNYPRANSPFVAICEGDDCWTDEYKLQTQVDLLNAHPDINLAFHQAHRLHYLDIFANALIIGDYGRQDGIIPFNDILFRTRGMVPTASCMIRQCAKERLMQFMQERPYLTLGDLYFQFFGSEPNGALYIARPMSLYRYGTEHSWSRRVKGDIDYKFRHEKAMLRSYIDLDEATDGTHHDRFVTLSLQRLLWLFKPAAEAGTPFSQSILDDGTLPDDDIRRGNLKPLYERYRGCQAAIRNTLASWARLVGPKVVFGAGSGSRIILDTFGAQGIAAVIDRDNRYVGQTVRGIPVIGTDDLARYPDAQLLVSVPSADRSIIASLAERAGIPTSRVHYLFDGAIGWLKDQPIPKEYFLAQQP
jgi:glycosyltransferase involved in cell wall biosynthesis